MERLAASLSHEMNTPIATLRSVTETLIRGVKREASFPPGSRMPGALVELSGAIAASTSRLMETVARIQRFANLDRGAVRLVDINQLVRDAVTLMNSSVSQSQVKLNLQPLPQIWCRPRGLMVAITSILNNNLDSALPATIDTYPEGANVVVKVVCSIPEAECQEDANLAFAVVGGRIRARGWYLFAARQLVRENGGELRLKGLGGLEQVVMITLPTNARLSGQDLRPRAATDVA
jgi:K+-sensing histidine kinase KdpD